LLYGYCEGALAVLELKQRCGFTSRIASAKTAFSGTLVWLIERLRLQWKKCSLFAGCRTPAMSYRNALLGRKLCHDLI